jgi:hypothetical protein
MKIICHRGNLNGPNPITENHPAQIDLCITSGYDVEIDLWFHLGEFYLGHDTGVYKIPFSYLLERKTSLWIHCKNQDALFELNNLGFNYFWHQEDDVTLTSQEFIWAYPGKHTNNYRNLVVLDFSEDVNLGWYKTFGVYAVCVDYVGEIK